MLKSLFCGISLQHRYNITKTVRKFPIDTNLNQVGPQFYGGPLPKAVSHGDENHESLNELDEGAAVLTADNFDRISSEYETFIVPSYHMHAFKCHVHAAISTCRISFQGIVSSHESCPFLPVHYC